MLLISRFAYGNEINLCAVDEVVIASCQLDEVKHRVLSICYKNNGKNVFYRFGRKENVELFVSFSREKRISRWIDFGTYTTYFGFRRGRYSYVLGIPEESYGARAFVKIKKDEEKVMSRNCIANSFGEKLMRSPLIEDVEDEVVRRSDFIFPPK
ncbi:hypothetical protein [Pseudomonas panipatensis]|uniref:hypothetical protein n=1 Tax=Pseudomonas panipatensis TaxID=428992 RepID=UPI001113687F|nr:hypothetical protein [Pseudomonas panipatensis]